MPKLEYFLVCESVSIDQTTNRISLFNVVEDLRILSQGESGRRVSNQLVAVACWNREHGDENEDFQALFRIHAPDSDSNPPDFPMNFRMEQLRQRLTLHIQGLPMISPGTVTFELLLNSKHVASHTINVFPAEATTTAISPNSGPIAEDTAKHE